jgi:predicted dehydrogenase
MASGVLGPISSFEARLERYRPLPTPDAWRERGDPCEAGGLLYDLGSHLIDEGLQLFGRPIHMYAELERRRPGTHVDDDSFVSLHFVCGVRAQLWMSYLARLPGPSVRIAGLRGTYVKMEMDPRAPAPVDAADALTTLRGIEAVRRQRQHAHRRGARLRGAAAYRLVMFAQRLATTI